MDEKHDDLWALILSEGKRFLGKINGIFMEHDGEEYLCTEGLNKNDILLDKKRLVQLKPVLDFVSIDQPQPVQDERGNMKFSFMKNPVVLPFDYAMKGATVYTKWSTIMFIDDLEDEDKKVYRELIADGMSKTARRADEPLVKLAPPGTRLPPVLRGNGGR